MTSFQRLLAATAMLVTTAGSGHAATATLADYSLTKYEFPAAFLYTTLTFSAFQTNLSTLLTNLTAFNTFKSTILAAGTSFLMGSTGETQWQGSLSFVDTTVQLAGITIASVGAEPTPVDGGVSVVPGPVAAAGLPGVLGLIGFAAWRRRRAIAA